MRYLIAHTVVEFGEDYGLRLATVVSVQVTKSVDGIGTRCQIVCPLTALVQKAGEESPYTLPTRRAFTQGMRIRVTAWYDNYPYRTIFQGYVFQVREGTPCTIVCEDEVYLMRTGILNRSWTESVTLREILEYTVEKSGVKVSEEVNDVADVTFTNFHIEDASPLYVLQQIRSDMKLVVTFQDGKLVATGVSRTAGNSVRLRSDVNVIGCDIQQPDGVWKNFRLSVEFNDENGKKRKFSVGEGDETNQDHGRLEVINCTGMTQEEARTFVDTYLMDTLRCGMYEGTLTTLLYPDVELFSIVDYEDKVFDSLNGSYKVKGVTLNIDSSGCRQRLTLAMLASDGLSIPSTSLSYS